MQKIIVLFTILLFSFPVSAQNEKWKYLGQTPSGDVPEVFASGIVSTERLEHGSPVFTPDLKEVYWATVEYPLAENTKTIYCCRYENAQWTKPEIVSFSGKFADDTPVIYNNKIFFSSDRGLHELSDSLRSLHWTLQPNSRIWYCERKDEKWSTPVLFSIPFEENLKIMGLSFSKNGNICFMSHLDGVEQQCGIFMATQNKDIFSSPIPLPASINSKFQDWTPFIALDESYIIFSSTRNPHRKDYGDLYISFKTDGGNWTEAIYMGDIINTPEQERFPSVSPDGKYLFFTRWTEENGQDVFWVSAKIIDDLRSKLG